MADERTKPESEAADAAANEAPPEEATVTDATTPVGDAAASEAEHVTVVVPSGNADPETGLQEV